MKKAHALCAAAFALALTGCHKGEHVHAVDMTETAAKEALAKAPAAEPIVFDDDGAALFPGTVTARTANAPAQSQAASQAPAEDEAASDNPAPADQEANAP